MGTITNSAHEQMLETYVINDTVFVRVMGVIDDDAYEEMLNVLLKIRDDHCAANMVFDISALSHVPFTLFCILKDFSHQARNEGWNVYFTSASNNPADGQACAMDVDQEPI